MSGNSEWRSLYGFSLCCTASGYRRPEATYDFPNLKRLIHQRVKAFGVQVPYIQGHMELGS